MQEVAMDPILLLNRFVDQISINRATHLARTGRYHESETILRELLLRGRTNPAVLDLLARIRGQQNRLDDAEALWQEALSLDPDSGLFRDGLARISELKKKTRVFSRRVVNILKTVTLVLICLFAGYLFQSLSVIKTSLAELQPVSVSVLPTPTAPDPRVAEILQSQSAMGKQITVIAVQMESLVNQALTIQPVPVKQHHTGGFAKLPEISMEVHGVEMRAQENYLGFYFQSGVFSRGILIKPEARQQITSLGHFLEQLGDLSRIEVTGYTDDLPVLAGSRYFDNTMLGYQRALTVMECLRRDTSLGADIFSVASRQMPKPFHPLDSAAHRLKNRTVVIKVFAQ